MQSIKFTKTNDQDDVGRMIGLAFAGFFAAIFIGLFFGLPLMWLWNAIVPKIFALPAIGYWQTVGLFILAKFFFGFGGGGGKGAGRKHTAKDHTWKHWGHAKSDESAPTDDESLQQYWQQEGKAAYESFLAARKSSETSKTDSSST